MNAEATPVLVLHGVNGHVEVYSNKVRIRRKGVLSKLTQGLFAGEKDIYFHQIGSILVEQAGLMTRGYIYFAPLGAVERRKGLLGTTHDENAVLFRRNQSAVVEDIRRYIEAHMGAGALAAAPDVADQLRKLGELRDSRFLTSAEFEAKKQELLGRL
jgi:hypothetical protein